MRFPRIQFIRIIRIVRGAWRRAWRRNSKFTRSAVLRLKRKLVGKRIAILGSQQVGKTTLLRFLRDGKLLDPRRHTVDAKPGGKFSMNVGGRTVYFEVPKDLPGNDSALGYAEWKAAFLGAHCVWYLFRADKIAQGDLNEIAMVREHLDRLKEWMGKKVRRPKIILVGTHADNEPGYGNDIGQFTYDVSKANPIAVGLVKLNNAGLVVGSLLTKESSTVLIESLRRNL